MRSNVLLKILGLTLCLLAALHLIACRGGIDEPARDTESAFEESTEKPTEGPVLIDENGKSPFSIIRGEHAEGFIIKCASRLYLDLKEEYPESGMKFRDDFLIRDEQPGEFEIMIGESKREGSSELQDSLRPNTFAIRVTDKKVYICAHSPALIKDAIEYFKSSFLIKDGEGRIVIKKGEYKSEPISRGIADLVNSEGATAKSKKLYDVPAVSGKRIMQGGCTDGKYMYYAMVNSGDTQTACIRKYDIATGKLVKTSDAIATDHSNDITYNPDTNQLVVCHNAPNRTFLSIVDAETLEFVKKVEIPFKIFCISYQPERGVYVVGISGGQDFTVLNKNFKVDSTYVTSGDRFIAENTEYTTQGMETDLNYIYFVQYKKNVIMVYDWKGKFVNQIALDIPSGIEPENISLVGDAFYIACNNSSWSGGVVYKTEIKLPGEK